MSVLILGIVTAGLLIIEKYDRKLVPDRGTIPLFAVGVLAGTGIAWRAAGCQGLIFGLLLDVIMGCLLLACITDWAICQVYNFVWWISGGAAVLLLPGSRVFKEGKNLWALLLFCMLQLLFFVRMYGRGDCYAFCVCAVVEAAVGKGLLCFLLHMLAAFGLLSIVQSLQHNVSRSGNLKRPVPFIPYITFSFFVLMMFI